MTKPSVAVADEFVEEIICLSVAAVSAAVVVVLMLLLLLPAKPILLLIRWMLARDLICTGFKRTFDTCCVYGQIERK